MGNDVGVAFGGLLGLWSKSCVQTSSPDVKVAGYMIGPGYMIAQY